MDVDLSAASGETTMSKAIDRAADLDVSELSVCLIPPELRETDEPSRGSGDSPRSGRNRRRTGATSSILRSTVLEKMSS
ncbi:hypothetical protein C8039_12640 [Halogeometricum sp. wsp3]|nr:hypothetical protein C8039_12640 [Halogeometricum sp. wsp3]